MNKLLSLVLVVQLVFSPFIGIPQNSLKPKPAESLMLADNKLMDIVDGPVMGMALQGNYLYATMGRTLGVFDVSDPARITQVFQSAPVSPDGLFYVAVGGSLAVVTHRYDLGFFDITDPTHPTFLGLKKIPGLYFERVIFRGNDLFCMGLMYDASILGVIDTSDLSAIKLAGYTTVSPDRTSQASDFTIDGNRAYVDVTQKGIDIYDISTPKSPLLLSTYPAPGYTGEIVGRDGIVYVADPTQGVLVLDVSQPNQVVELTRIPRIPRPNGWSIAPNRLRLVGNRLYWGNGMNEFALMDVSVPAHPQLLSANYSPSGAYQFEVDPLTATIFLSGISAVSLADPTKPVQVGEYLFSQYAGRMVRRGNLLYVPEGASESLLIEDVSDPLNPAVIGYFSIPAPDRMYERGSIALSSNIVAMAGGSNVYLVDVTDPTQPTLISQIDWAMLLSIDVMGSNMLISLDIVGRYLYTTTKSRLSIFDIIDPQNPINVGYIEFPYSVVKDIAVHNGYAYIVNQGQYQEDHSIANPGMDIIDVSDPTNPKYVKYLPSPSKVSLNRVTALGNYVYAAIATAASGGFWVVDVENPALAYTRWHLNYGSTAFDVQVAGSHAYLGLFGGAVVMDFSDMDQPTEAARYLFEPYCSPVSLIPAQGLFFTSNWGCGLGILSFDQGTTYSVQGRVAFDNGDPLPGVMVTDSLGNVAITNAQGEYQLEGVVGGQNQVEVAKEGYEFKPALREVDVHENQTGVDFGIVTQFSITGKVADANGNGIMGVTVQDQHGRTVMTDAQGNYRLKGLPEGSYTLTAVHPDYELGPASKQVALPPSAEGVNFSQITHCVAGRFVDENGVGVPGITITANPSSKQAVSGADGSYQICGLVRKTYTLSPAKEGMLFEPLSSLVDVPTQELINFVALTPKYFIVGIVYNQDWEPMSGILVSDGIGHTSVTDAVGYYLFNYLPAGTYTIRPITPGFKYTPSAQTVTLPQLPNPLIIDFHAEKIKESKKYNIYLPLIKKP